MQSRQYFEKIRIGNHDLVSLGKKFSMEICVLQALEDGRLAFPMAFLLVREMISYWPQIVSYISTTGQSQENQPVQGRLCIFYFLLLSRV